MSEQIVTVAEIQRRARIAFAAGTDCPFPWHSLAAETWQAEISRLESRAQASPQSHLAPVSVLRIDEAHPC